MIDNLSLPQSVVATLTCLVVLLPLAFLGLRYNYRFALQQATTKRESDELTNQYRLLLICLLIGVAMVLADTQVIGLIISVILLLVAGRVYKHRVTVLAAHSRGKFVCIGPATVWSMLVYVGWAFLLAILALVPYLPQMSP